MRFVRDWFTDELVERPTEQGGRQIIAREMVPYQPRRRYANPWDTGKEIVNRNMSIKPEEATPEKIAQLNENARLHGTGAWYDSQGGCHITAGRGCRSREMRARAHVDFGFQDNDAGYGDWAGH
jgi:hypothetical protein